MRHSHLAATIASVVASVLAGAATAAVLPKDVQAVRENFDALGATACSLVMAETLDFLSKGKPVTVNRQWNTGDPNGHSIFVDFLIGGTKSDYSQMGSIVLTPRGSSCVGSYATSFTLPGKDCADAMSKNGFDDPDWVEAVNDPNGDGGTVRFVGLKSNTALSFVFNDVAGGCAVLKREGLDFEQKK